ncbi:hypothetical protein [Nocardioides caldifontis]|uniref:hypothetical protein n=1 Tax=Nocardioides caldifontis TaxID=2588938 RepID=UPI00193A819C|nr:hypothetical protein [Nocardioides caldifontis]
MTRWPLSPWQPRSVLNAVNLSTPLGLLVGVAGRVRFRRGPRGLVLGTGYRLPVPVASAFTVGDVVLTKHGPELFEERPRLLAHEERHAWQYAASLGLPFLVLYLLAAGWSWLRGGDPVVHNPFERLAGLADGGYPALSARERRRRAAAGRPRSA